MTEPPRTPGELLFEAYLASQQIPFAFEKDHPGKKKKPDYTLQRKGQTILLDVKDFDPPKQSPMGFGAFDPYPAVREKVEQGRNKFKEYKEHCCGLVLYNRGNPHVMLGMPDIVLGMMYGDSGFTFPVNTHTGIGDASKLERAFLGRGKMVRPRMPKPQNTTISALITLTTIRPDYHLLVEAYRAASDSCTVQDCHAQLEQTVPDYDPDRTIPRVIVWHSAVARIPLPGSLFCGPYDTHFGVVEDENGGLVQRVTYRGVALPDSVDI